MNSNKERISQTIILEQKKNGMPNPLYERAKEIVESIVMNIDPQKKKKKKKCWKIKMEKRSKN